MLRRRIVRAHRGLVVALAIALATACQDHDPLSPLVPPRRLSPKESRTLSGSLAVASPSDINAAGEVIGTIPVGTAYHAAISLDGTAYDIGTIDQSSGTSTRPTGINSRGEVVGWESKADGTMYSFLWIPDTPNGTTGKMQRLPAAPSGEVQAFGINDAGEIVGTLVSGVGAVLWTERGATVLELPSLYPGGPVFWTWINAYGQIAGSTQDSEGYYHAFVWTPTTPNSTTGQLTVADGGYSDYGWTLSGLNDQGQLVVTPYWGYGATLWTPSTPNGTSFSPTYLDVLWATDINSRGDVLTTSYGPSSPDCGVTYHVYLWRPDAPHGTTGTSIDMTPDAGMQVVGGQCAVYAYSNILSEEENGSIEAFGTLSDWNGNYSDQMWTATDLGVPRPIKPTISWSGFASEGSDVLFDATGTAPYSGGLQFQWNFGDGGAATGARVIHQFADNGSYTVSLTVTDATGQSASAMAAVAVSNLAPMATFGASPTTVNEGGSYTLSVSNIRDVAADLPSVRVALDCGDGQGYRTVASAASLTCAAPNEAARVARAQLVDKDGGVREYTAAISVLNVAPVVTIVSAPSAVTTQVNYTISFKFSDPGLLDQWRYSVDWGDGTTTYIIDVPTQGTTITESHRFNVSKKGGVKSATYIVRATVMDNGGGSTTAQAPVQVTVANGHP